MSPAEALHQPLAPHTLKRKTDETVIEATQIVQPTPYRLPRSERPVAENHAEWLEMQARQAAGETLSQIDLKFVQNWPNTNQGKAWFKHLGLQQEKTGGAP